MLHYEDQLPTQNGSTLFNQYWVPRQAATATVAVVHGFTEHGGRYAALAEALTSRGYSVHALDLRGHGRSGGQRVFIHRFDEYLDDVAWFLQCVRDREPGKPLFVFGHSMGGTIAALLAACRQPEWAGMALSAPAVSVGRKVFPMLRRIAPLVGWMFPRLRVARLGSRFLSRDPAAVASFQADPLVFQDRFPVRTGIELLHAAARVQKLAPKLQTPLLVMQGTGDWVVDHQGARLLFDRAGSADKTLRMYEGLYHELLSEPERDEVVADLIAWLDARR